MSRSNDSHSSQVSRATALIAGVKKRYTNPSEQLEFGGATFSVAQILGMLQSILDLRAAVVAAQAVAKSKVALERSQSAPLVQVLDGFTAFLHTRFGKDAEALSDFGLVPRKVPAPLSAEEKAAAAAKRKATRDARHTMGPKQKKDIKGNVSAELVVTPMGSDPAKTPPKA